MKNKVVNGAGVLILLIGVLLPLFVSDYWVRTVTLLFMLAGMAQGWNFIGGYTGYPAFGNVAFFGMGAYTTGILMNKTGWTFVPSFVVSGIVAALFAILIGLPVLRLKGHYFAIATLGVAEAVREIADNWVSLTEGGHGMTLPISQDPNFGLQIYYTMLGILLASVLMTYLLSRTRWIYGMVAIREDEDAAKVMGINTTFFKVLAFMLSGLITGFIGGLYAYWNTFIDTNSVFTITYTLHMIIITILGGPGTVLGPVVGAVLFHAIRTFLWLRFTQLHALFLGLVIVFVIIFMPKGVMDVVRGRRHFTWGYFLRTVRESRV
jgi:branched-chain amino acid transport system permease protein